MVDVNFYQTNKETEPSISLFNNRLFFKVPKPIIIQPSEIIKIPMGIVIKIPDEVILIITTHLDLSKKACELFPSVSVVDSSVPEQELNLAVRNNGRSQINLPQGHLLAIGYLSPIQTISLEDFDPKIKTQSKFPKTSPQKKNPFNFEVK